MQEAPIVKMSAERQAQYIQHLIDKMFGNDVHDQPAAKETLREIVKADRHSDDCARTDGRICNCGIREAKTFIQAEA